MNSILNYNERYIKCYVFLMLGNFSHNNVNSKIYFTISFKAFVFHISIVARPKTERLLC